MTSRLPFLLAEPSPSLVQLKERIDATLELVTRELREEVGREAEEAAALGEELRRAVLAGGKRLRPSLLVYGYRAAGGMAEDPIMRVAAGLELLHTFAIVQDDLMDGSRTRRGSPTLHVRLAGHAVGTDQERALAHALLVADLAMVVSDRLLAEAPFPPDRILAAMRRYNRMRHATVVGQYLDLRPPPPGEEAAEEAALLVGALKSGRYSVEGPVLVGAELGGGSPEVLEALGAYGRTLGQAFQLRDDLLGVFGGPELSGKDAGADLRQGKRTVVIVRALKAASEAERRFLEARLGQPGLTDGEVEQVRQVIRESGALAGTIALIDELVERASESVRTGAIPEEAREDLLGIARSLLVRER